MVNFQTFGFLTTNSVTTGARELNGTRVISLATHNSKRTISGVIFFLSNDAQISRTYPQFLQKNRHFRIHSSSQRCSIFSPIWKVMAHHHHNDVHTPYKEVTTARNIKLTEHNHEKYFRMTNHFYHITNCFERQTDWYLCKTSYRVKYFVHIMKYIVHITKYILHITTYFE